MRVLNFFTRLFKRKSVPTTAATEARRDLSLRPSSETYLDQHNESTIVLSRIHNSSSSVIGIAGVRGAGKSSLALKVLESCAKSSSPGAKSDSSGAKSKSSDDKSDPGYFTLLIHSPTSYEPREFLLSVFQRICEATIKRLERLFGQEQTIKERGRAELRRSQLHLRILLVGALAVLAASVGYGYYGLNRLRQQSREAFRQEVESDRLQSINSLKARLSDVTNGQVFLENCIKKPDSCAYLAKETSLISDERKSVLSRAVDNPSETNADFEKGFAAFEKEFAHELGPSYSGFEFYILQVGADRFLLSEEDIKHVIPQIPNDQLPALYQSQRQITARVRSQLDRFEKRGPPATPGNDLIRDYGGIALLAILVVVSYAVAIGFMMATTRARRRMELKKKYPDEAGLYQLAKETLEHLRYQTTMTSSQDASISIWKVASKFVRTKQLETRPVSMPGLTADCNAFIDNVAEVFGGKSVICLDELDKIIDPKQLEELLTGVKGILGQNRSHFILTVSEDALARFATRRRAERDIIESSFDEIISLNRVNFPIAQHIVRKMLALNEQDASSDRLNQNILMVWVFGGGIPREIKRNVVMAADSFDFVTGDPKELWRILFSNLVESLRSWALIASAEKDISYNFLVCLENIVRSRSDTKPDQDPKAWFNDLVNQWSVHYDLPFALSSAEPKGNGASGDHAEPFERGIFELMIGAYALLLVSDDETKLEAVPTERLLEVFTLLPYSPSFAGFRFRSLLTDAGIVGTSHDAATRQHEQNS